MTHVLIYSPDGEPFEVTPRRAFLLAEKGWSSEAQFDTPVEEAVKPQRKRKAKPDAPVPVEVEPEPELPFGDGKRGEEPETNFATADTSE